MLQFLENIGPLKRVVVLGSGGFIGSHLVRALESGGVATLALSSKDLDLSDSGSADRLAAQLRPDDSIVMVSALTPDKGRDFGTLIANLKMAHHVLLALRKTKVRQFVAISSDAVYDDNASLVREATTRAPGTFHGVMHLSREIAFINGLKELSIPLLVVRPSAVFGAGDTHNGYGPNRFMKSALETGEISLFGGGEEKRDHVFIGDVVNLILLGLSTAAVGSVNAVSGTALSFMEVAEVTKSEIGRIANRKVSIKTSVRHNPITHRHFDVSSLVASFPQFRMTNLQDGIAETLASKRK